MKREKNDRCVRKCINPNTPEGVDEGRVFEVRVILLTYR